MTFFKKILSSKGQSSVEYILLFAVMATITMAILNTNEFKKMFGKDAEFFVALKKYMEYGYRHGSPGSSDTSVAGSGGVHELYFNPKTGKSRFFVPLEPN